MDDGDGSEPGSGPRASEEPPHGSPLAAAPGLMRIAATAWLRTAEWTVGASARAASRLTKAALSGESAAELLDDARTELREQARRALGVVDPDTRTFTSAPSGSRASEDSRPVDPLRERGAELLAQSADVDYDQDTHPAYERILKQLAPDEARILRLLATRGDQAAIDVRTWRPFGVGAQTVAPGLSMIGAEAGCRYPDRVPAYLNNLYRLGLIWFSREPIEGLTAYQVLEAQPEAIAAGKKAGRAKIVRRSIRLTPFGQDFCERSLPLDTAEFEALTRGADPDPARPG